MEKRRAKRQETDYADSKAEGSQPGRAEKPNLKSKTEIKDWKKKLESKPEIKKTESKT